MMLDILNGQYDIRIYNSGAEIRMDQREEIFDRFYQTDSGKKDNFGIGLHLSREIFRMHQGTVRVLESNETGTTFQILLGLVPPETGEIRIFGKPYTELTAKDRERIGVSLADSGFSQFLTVRDVTAILRNLYTRFDETRFLEKCQRYELPANKKIKDFSTGMQAKLKLLIAMSHDADLLILDDLGTEYISQLTISVLYELINTRMLCHRPTIYTSNIVDSSIFEARYTEKVASRILGSCQIFKFFGTDQRLKRGGKR